MVKKSTVCLYTGAFDSLHDTSKFIRVIEKRQKYKIECIKKIASGIDSVDNNKLLVIAEPLKKSRYGLH
jgi:glucose-1-phosphate thymidylyltransferase